MPQKTQTKKGFANMIVLIIFLLTMGGTVLYFKNFPLEKLPAGEPIKQLPVPETQKKAPTNPSVAPAQVPGVPQQTEEVKKVTVAPVVANTAVTNQSLSQIKNKPFWQELLNGSYNESQIMISFVSGGIRTGKQQTSAELASHFEGSAFSESESKRIIQAIGGYPKEFYVEATMLLKDPSLSAEQRARIADLLGSASTVEGVKILGQAWKETKDSAFHSAVVESFRSGSLVEVRPWTLPNHLNLSKELESLWLTIEDPSFSQAIALWIARIGDASGIELFLREISKEGKTVDELLESGSTRAIAGVIVMKEVRNPQAIPTLKKTFTSQPDTSATFFACGDALAYALNIENTDATQTLINWVLQAPDEMADIAGGWFRVASRTTASQALIQKSLTSATVFRSQKVKTAVLEAIL